MKIKLILLCCLAQTGCTSLWSSQKNEIADNPELLSYKLDYELNKSNCIKTLNEKEKRYQFHRDDYKYRYYVGEKQLTDPERCMTLVKKSIENICFSSNGVMKGFWCERRDNYPVFNIIVREDSKDVNKIHIEFAEPVKGYEKQWRRAAIVSGFIDHAYENEKKKEKEKYEKQEFIFNTAAKGTPVLVLKSPVGTRICKVDVTKSRGAARPENWVYYSGFIENKTKAKILVRYEAHFSSGPPSSYYNDVHGLIAWSRPDGWYVCDN